MEADEVIRVLRLDAGREHPDHAFYHLLRTKQLRGIKYGGRWHVVSSEVVRFLVEHGLDSETAFAIICPSVTRTPPERRR